MAGTPAKKRTPRRKTRAANGRSSTRDIDRARVDEHGGAVAVTTAKQLTEDQRVLLADLFAVVEEHAGESVEPVDRDLVERAFVFACERHADQRRASGEDFIVHPVGVAKICAGMRLDTETLCAALLHDTVEDTSASLDEVVAELRRGGGRAGGRRHQALRESPSRAATTARPRTTGR